MDETSPSDDVAEMHKVICESDSGENHTECENGSTQRQGDECRCASETSRVHVLKEQMG